MQNIYTYIDDNYVLSYGGDLKEGTKGGLMQEGHCRR